MDGALNRLYSWRYNPLYHSGALTVALMIILLVTGTYLLFFYRIGSPYDSVVRLQNQVWLGRWIRSLHRFASDAAVVAIAIHAVRIFAQRRAWGPRALAWLSGLALLGLTLVCGWTGYVMVWDIQGLVLAREGARFLDALPFFSEPIARAFVGEREIPSAFFFLNLFLHVALPLGMGVALWIHVARIARPALLPPKKLAWGVTGLLILISVIWPVAMAPEADLFHLPRTAPYDWFYSFWLPVTALMPPWAAWIGVTVLTALASAIPWWTRPKIEAVASRVETRLCDGCRQCYLDCPYEAIAMIPMEGSRKGIVAEVEPSLCVSCGICSGSCAPMGVGPPGRTGRDQLGEVRSFIKENELGERDVVVVACGHGIGLLGQAGMPDDVPLYSVECIGSMHTSILEFLVRSGVGGVLIASCPPRDCWHREGPHWLEERLYNDREAELKSRVDRRRVRVSFLGGGDAWLFKKELESYRRDIGAIEGIEAEKDVALDLDCRTDVSAEEVGR